jgi:hypothetical protein
MKRILVCAWLVSLPQLASANVRPNLSEEQIKIMVYVEQEARAQGVPIEVALAFAEVETMFRDKHSGNSYGPLQVDKSGVFPDEHPFLHKLEWNVRKGIEILKLNLKRAKGQAKNARYMYVCGRNFKRSCSPTKLAIIDRRWAPVAERWGVKGSYDFVQSGT